MPNVCRQIELGRSGSVPEVMIKWEGIVPVEYHRTTSMVAYAELCGPEDVINGFWHDIVNCAIAAAAAAGLTIIIAGPSAAVPAFEDTFSPCIAAKINQNSSEIHVSLSTQQQPNEDWHK